MPVNWGLAGPGFDPLQALQIYGAAQQRQVEQRQLAQQQQARQLATQALQSGDFNGATAALVGIGDYQGANALSGLAKTAHEQRGNQLFARSIRGTASPQTIAATQPPAQAAAPQGAQPVLAQRQQADGDIVVNARPSMEETVAQLAEVGGPELVQKFMGYRESVGKLDKAQREQLNGETEVIASFVPQLLALPLAQRTAFLEQNRQFLNQRGIDDNEIANVDVSDAGLNTLQTNAIGVKAAVQMAQEESQFVRRQEQQASEAAASRAVTMRGQDMTNARARESNVIAAGGVGKAVQKTETDLRKEFDGLPQVKTFQGARTAYNQILSLAGRKNATAQDDLATIYTFMRSLDPTSTVREGEFATAQNAASVPESLRNLYNRAASGNRLNRQQRVEMVNTAGRAYAQQRESYNTAARQYRQYASDYGVDPNRVARTYSRVGGSTPASSLPEGWKIERVK